MYISYSAGEIASTGHTAAHDPQSMQASSSISYAASPCSIAWTGHSPSHDPHDIHVFSSIL